MRVATWNLERQGRPGSARAARQRGWMDWVDADVWVLTETHRELAPGEGFEGVACAPMEGPALPGEVWVAIWSRWPLTALRVDGDPGRMAAARVEVPGRGAVVVVGTVLPWLGSQWNGVPGKGGAAFRAAVEAQVADWRRYRWEEPDAALVVAGDFNQDFAERHYYGSRANRAALERVFSDVGVVCVTGGARDPVAVQSRGSRRASPMCVSMLGGAGWSGRGGAGRRGRRRRGGCRTTSVLSLRSGDEGSWEAFLGWWALAEQLQGTPTMLGMRKKGQDPIVLHLGERSVVAKIDTPG